MTSDVATTAEKWGAQTCTRQARLLAQRKITPAEATAVIVHALHRMAGLTPPKERAVTYACDDCGRRLDTRTIQTHDCLTDDVDAPDGPDYTDDDLDRFADREVARYEAMVYGEDGAA